MIVAGIVENEEKISSINLMSQILTNSGKKTSIISSRSLIDLDLNKVSSYLKELKKNNTDILLIGINLEDLIYNVFTNFNFNVIIFIEKADELTKDGKEKSEINIQKLFLLLDENATIIVNIDDNERINIIQGKKISVLTFGFNSKSTITASSTGEGVMKDDFICCIQRSILTKDGDIVEPQEFSIKINVNNLDAYGVMAAAAFIVYLGINVDTNKIIGLKSDERFIYREKHTAAKQQSYDGPLGEVYKV